MKIKISGIIPVHNEAEYLRYSLPSLHALGLDEYIFVLDRCTDHSHDLIKTYAPENSYILIKEWQHWTRTRAGESFQYGFDYATHDIVFAIGADLIISPEAIRLAKHHLADLQVGAVFYGPTQRSIQSLSLRIHSEYLNFRVRYWLSRLPQGTRSPSTGIYAYRRHIAPLHDTPSDYISLEQRIRAKGYRTIYIPDADIIHLRPPLSKNKQLWAGTAQARLGRPLRKVLYSSLINLKPYELIGYIQHRTQPYKLPSPRQLINYIKTVSRSTLAPILPQSVKRAKCKRKSQA